MEIYHIHYIRENDDGYGHNYFSDVYYKNKNKAVEKLLEENFYDSGESAEDYIIYQSAEDERSYARIKEVTLMELDQIFAEEEISLIEKYLNVEKERVD